MHCRAAQNKHQNGRTQCNNYHILPRLRVSILSREFPAKCLRWSLKPLDQALAVNPFREVFRSTPGKGPQPLLTIDLLNLEGKNPKTHLGIMWRNLVTNDPEIDQHDLFAKNHYLLQVHKPAETQGQKESEL